MSELDRIRLAKALTTMSAEWGAPLEELIAGLDAEPDDSDVMRWALALLDESPRGAWDEWLHGKPVAPWR